MSLTFYYAPMSTASLTEAVLAELGTPCDRIKLDISAGDTRKPDFLKLNPNGKVPVIVHEGTPIWESAAITMYLGEVFGVEANLYPAPGPKRGEAMKWIVWSNVTLVGATRAVQANSLESPEQQSVIALEKAKADLAVCFEILNGGLEGKSFLLGDYSLADTHLQGIVGWIGSMGTDLTAFPNITEWLQRCMARPALAQM